jgi:hypothetical protein
MLTCQHLKSTLYYSTTYTLFPSDNQVEIEPIRVLSLHASLGCLSINRMLLTGTYKIDGLRMQLTVSFCKVCQQKIINCQ